MIAGVFQRFDSVGPGSYLIAFAAGVLSFLSPCVLPLVPGYLSVITGFDVPTMIEHPDGNRRRIAATTLLFISGFALVYVPIGTVAGAFGETLKSHQSTLTRFSGVAIVAFAVFLGGSVVAKAPWIYQELRFHPRLDRFGRITPLILGMAFAFGWSPCTGPIAGSAATIAIEHGRALTGASLLLVYTLGLGLPFLLCGLLLARATPLLARIKRHYPAIMVGSAAVMLIFGALLVTNKLSVLNKDLSNFLSDHGMGWIKDYS